MRPWRGSMPLATKEGLPVANRIAYRLRLLWWWLTKPYQHDHMSDADYCAEHLAWRERRPVRK
jgi:hypothetical protein